MWGHLICHLPGPSLLHVSGPSRPLWSWKVQLQVPAAGGWHGIPISVHLLEAVDSPLPTLDFSPLFSWRSSLSQVNSTPSNPRPRGGPKPPTPIFILVRTRGTRVRRSSAATRRGLRILLLQGQEPLLDQLEGEQGDMVPQAAERRALSEAVRRQYCAGQGCQQVARVPAPKADATPPVAPMGCIPML